MNSLNFSQLDYNFDRNLLDFWDFLLTPFYIFVIYLLAMFYYRKYVTKKTNTIRKYFFVGLTLKLVGAISICFIFSYYYIGGDMNAYFNDGKILAKITLADPVLGTRLLFATAEKMPMDLIQYVHPLRFEDSSPTYVVDKICCIVELFTFQTLIPTSLVFSFVSFLCLWSLFSYLSKILNILENQLAFSLFYIPSFFFWGSGILKDTICISLLSICLIKMHKAFVARTNILFNFTIAIGILYILSIVKIYILMAFLPTFVIYLYFENLGRIKSKKNRIFLTPLVIVFSFVSSLALIQIGDIFGSKKLYSVDNIMQTSEITRTYLEKISNKYDGSGYSLGDFDYSLSGLASVAPKAINVTLFRPYLWEADNPVFLLSAIESTSMFLLTLYLILRSGPKAFLKTIFQNNFVLFAISFTIIFSFAIGISTYNFGSLVRYKIPIIPFYLISLFIIYNTENKKNLSKSIQ